jgi:hypothetical protein
VKLMKEDEGSAQCQDSYAHNPHGTPGNLGCRGIPIRDDYAELWESRKGFITALRELLECPALNLDEDSLEYEDRAALARATAVMATVTEFGEAVEAVGDGCPADRITENRAEDGEHAGLVG